MGFAAPRDIAKWDDRGYPRPIVAAGVAEKLLLGLLGPKRKEKRKKRPAMLNSKGIFHALFKIPGPIQESAGSSSEESSFKIRRSVPRRCALPSLSRLVTSF